MQLAKLKMTIINYGTVMLRYYYDGCPVLCSVINPPSTLLRVHKKCLKLFWRLPNHTKSILQCASQGFELLRDALHRQCVGEEKELPRSFHVPIPHDIESSDGIDLQCIIIGSQPRRVETRSLPNVAEIFQRVEDTEEAAL